MNVPNTMRKNTTRMTVLMRSLAGFAGRAGHACPVVPSWPRPKSDVPRNLTTSAAFSGGRGASVEFKNADRSCGAVLGVDYHMTIADMHQHAADWAT